MEEGLMSLILSIVGGAMSSSSHDKASGEISALYGQQKVPEAAITGGKVMEGLAGQGLPGYESMMSGIDAEIPMTLNAAKDYITSGGMIDLLTKLSAKSEEQKRNLGYADSEQKLKNQSAYANYMGGTLAPMEVANQNMKNQLALMGIGENEAKTKDLLGMISKGGTGITDMTGNDDWIKSLILNKKNTGVNADPIYNPDMYEKYGTGSYSDNVLNTIWNPLQSYGN